MSISNILQPENKYTIFAENLVSNKINGIQGTLITESNTVGQVLKITSVENKTVQFQNDSGGGGFPLVVTGDSLNALKVEKSDFTNIFQVDTITPQVNISEGAPLVLSGVDRVNKIDISGDSSNQKMTYGTTTTQPLNVQLDVDSLLTISRNPALSDAVLAGLLVQTRNDNKLLIGNGSTASALLSEKDLSFSVLDGDIDFSSSTKNYLFQSKAPQIVSALPVVIDSPLMLTTKEYVDSVAGGGGFAMKSIVSTALQQSINAQIWPQVFPSGSQTFGSNLFTITTGKTLNIKFSGVLSHTGGNSVNVTFRDRNGGNDFPIGSFTFPNVPFTGTANYFVEAILSFGDVVAVPSSVPSRITIKFSYEGYDKTGFQTFNTDLSAGLIELGCTMNPGTIGDAVNSEQIIVIAG